MLKRGYSSPLPLKDETRFPQMSFKDALQVRRDVWMGWLLRRRRIVFLLPLAEGDTRTGLSWVTQAARETQGLSERDITIIVMLPEGVGTDRLPPRLRQWDRETVTHTPVFRFVRYHPTQAKRLGDAPAFYLVGKDGGVKRATRHFPTLAELFAQIDTMPMRRQEMRERGHG